MNKVRCMECNRSIEDRCYDPEYKLCNYHYGEYISYLRDIFPDEYKKIIDEKFKK